VHRDVKPANVLVVSDDEDGHEHAYLTDFGIAREMAATGGVTRTGAVVGTVDYLAPERLEGDRGDARSDVYAFGCMLFESLSGEVPFPRDSDVAKMLAHANAPVPSLRELRPGVPPALVDVVERCMAKDPGERYAEAGALAGSTTSAVDATPAQETRPPGGPSPGPPTVASAEALPTTGAIKPAKGEGKKLLPVAPLIGLFVALAAAVFLILSLGGGGGGDDAGGGGEKPKRSSGSTSTIPVAGGPDGVTVAGGKAWVASARAGTLTPIDARSGSPGEAVQVGSNPDSVTSAKGSVWVTNTGDGTVSRVDDTSGQSRGPPIEVGKAPEGIAAGDGSVWVANAGEGSLSRLDAASGRPGGTTLLGGSPIGVATGPGSVWVTDSERGALVRLSSSSGTQQGEAIGVGAEPRGVAVSGGDVWVANSGDGTVSRIDARTGRQAQAPIKVGGGPREVAAAGAEGVWVTLSGAGQAIRIDREGRVAERKKVGAQPVGIAVEETRVWVASFGDDSVTRISR
ncbi:MAG: serine/threonine-protein kinase, partial [Actinomycetota bacterium]|nr:serine/threonine-protein kinase [Actinomycetota bacterium]